MRPGFADIDSEVNNEAANMVADASTTITTFYNQDGPHTFSVYALGIGHPGQRCPGPDPRQSRQAPQSEIGFIQPGEPYQWQALEVLAGVPQFPAEPEFVDVRPWPLDVGYDEMTDIGIRLALRLIRGRPEAAGAAGRLRGGQSGDHVGRRRHRVFDQGAAAVPRQEPCARVVSAG